MTKMADMSIYGKNPLKAFSLGLGMYSTGDAGPTKFVQMMILGWPSPTLHQGQICFLMHLNRKYFEKLIFLNNVEASHIFHLIC